MVSVMSTSPGSSLRFKNQSRQQKLQLFQKVLTKTSLQQRQIEHMQSGKQLDHSIPEEKNKGSPPKVMQQGRTFNESASYRQNDPAIHLSTNLRYLIMNDEQARLRMNRPNQPVPPPSGLSFIEKVTDTMKTQSPSSLLPDQFKRVTWERDELQAKLESQEAA
ncbi:hypothetical protein FGO68_gene4506 [Halteria grandinella]|uniref:Uncharacterized protein n=1 Tax=Halteria grandinella TaxID=5974 RepID=A0A8J8T5A6_HALGN|nr:hypothetical protein FGO68_gene4506 [Halteria grandinella]